MNTAVAAELGRILLALLQTHFTETALTGAILITLLLWWYHWNVKKSGRSSKDHHGYNDPCEGGCHQIISMSKLIADHTAQLQLKVDAGGQDWLQRQRRSKYYVDKINAEYKEVKKHPSTQQEQNVKNNYSRQVQGNPSFVSLRLFKSQETDSDVSVSNSVPISEITRSNDQQTGVERIQQLLTEWETSSESQKLNVNEFGEFDEIQQLRYSYSIFDNFDRANPFDDGNKLEEDINSLKFDGSTARMTKDKLCCCREDYLIRLQVFKNTIDAYEKMSSKLAVFGRVCEAEKLRAIGLNEELKKNSALTSELANEFSIHYTSIPDTKETLAQENNLNEQNNILEKYGNILSSAREMGDRILSYAAEVVNKFRSAAECCSRLNAFEKQWKQAIGQFVGDDGIEYRGKLTLDLRECLSLSLEDQEKCLRSYIRRFERLSEELSRNEQGILLKWKCYFGEQMTSEFVKPVSSYSNDLFEFIANCQKFLVEKRLLASQLERLSENNAAISEKIINITPSDGILLKKCESECSADHVDNVNRNRESFEIVCKSLELLSSYLSTLERRATAYNRTAQELTSCQAKLETEVTSFECRRNELYELREIVHKMLLFDFQERAVRISKLNDIFNILTNIRERCKEVIEEVSAFTDVVLGHSKHLQITYLDVEPIVDQKCVDLLQNWDVTEIKNGLLSQMLCQFDGGNILATFQTQKDSFPNLDDYLKYIDDLHCSLKEALSHYNSMFQQALSDLENLFSEDQLQQICNWKGNDGHAWKDYGEMKQKWILVCDEIIENKRFEVSQYFPQINPYSKRRAKDEKSDLTTEDFDKFYFDVFFRKTREINDTFCQTKRTIEDYCITVACYQNELLSYSELDENFKEKKMEAELRLYSSNETILEKYTTCTAVLESEKSDYWQCKNRDNQVREVIQEQEELNKDCQEVADEATKTKIYVEENNDKLIRINQALDLLRTSHTNRSRQINLDVHREHIEAFIRDVRDGENHSKIISPQRQISGSQGVSEVNHGHVMGLEEFGRWVENRSAKLNDVISTNLEQTTRLNSIIQATLEDDEQYDLLARNLDIVDIERKSQEWPLLCKSQDCKIGDFTEKNETLFITALQLMPNLICTTDDKNYPLLSFKPVGDFFDTYLEKYVDAVNLFRKLKRETKAAVDRFSVSAEENCKLFKTFVDLKDQIPALKPRLEEEKEKLDCLTENLESCRQRLQLHSERVFDLRQKHDVQTEAMNQIRQEEIDRVIAARNNYECLGLVAPETFYDTYTKDDINKAFRERTKLVHPDKCKLPLADQATKLLSKAKSELLSRYRYR